MNAADSAGIFPAASVSSHAWMAVACRFTARTGLERFDRVDQIAPPGWFTAQVARRKSCRRLVKDLAVGDLYDRMLYK
jgi:hypothetical protein